MSFATALPENKTALAGQSLLAELGVDRDISGEGDHPALAWRRSGLLDLSGQSDGPPRIFPADLTSVVDGAILALKSLAENPERLPPNGALLLGERARLMGLTRNGRSSPNGTCRLVDTIDGRIALNLARDDDWGLMEAWLESLASSWGEISALAQKKDTDALVMRGIDLGLAIAIDGIPKKRPWFQEQIFVPATQSQRTPLVVDLSSLWAGPLAGSLLRQMCAEVVKVESLGRPDGGRRGNAEFYDLLNAGKQSVAIDFGSQQGRSDLKRLIAAADIVIEASRPRALQQLGIEATEMLAQKPGKLWLSLTAYGRENGDRIGFGDDIGVAAGLCRLMEKQWGEPLFVGDAIADPISGILGALVAWAKWTNGGGCLIDLSMRDAVRRAMIDFEDNRNWQEVAGGDTSDLYPMRSSTGKAEELGTSTEAVLASLC